MPVRLVLSLAALLLLSSPVLALELGARTDLPTNGSPAAVAVADVDGDGDLDVVLALSNPAVLSLFRGSGLGTFEPRVDFPLRGQPTAVRVADVTGDGIVDLVSTCSPQWVCVLPGTGGGAFGTRTDFPVASGPVALETGDLNGDGRRDIVAACPLGTCVSVLLANTTGGFGPRTNFSTSATPAGVAIAQVTADARPDLLVTSAGADVMTVLENTGTGRFEFWQDFPTGSVPRAIATADFDGNGRADAAIVNSAAASVRVLLADADAGFVNGPLLATGTTPEGLACADIDGDGRTDIVTVNRGSSTVTVHFGNGAGAFGGRLDAPAGVAPLGVAVGRLDADTLADLAIATSGEARGIVLSWAASTTTALTSAANPAWIADTLTLTATVTPASATGQVRFLEGDVVRGTGELTGGRATARIATLGLGTHTLVAAYLGGPQHAASTSPPLSQQVTLRPTSIALSTSPNPSSVNASVNLSAVVTPATAPGFVEFRDGGVALGQASIVAGVANIGIPFGSTGTHTLTASYLGSGLYGASISAPVQQQVQEVNGIVLTVSPNPSPPGRAVTLTAVVTPSASTGSVTFFDGTTSLGTTPLVNGAASLTVPSFTLGGHELTAAYSGDATHPPATSSPVGLVVRRSGSLTVLQLGAPSAAVGSPVWFRARVTGAPPDTSRPSGTVQFRVDGVAFGAPIPLPADTSWVTSDTTRALAVGSHSVVAVYGGDVSFDGSTSTTATQVIPAGPSSITTLQLGAPSIFVGDRAWFRARVVAAPPATGRPSGTVQFRVDGVAFGAPIPLPADTSWVTSDTTRALSVGSHSVVAVYGGDVSFDGSTSTTATQVIPAVPSSITTLQLGAPNIFVGDRAWFRARVVAAPPATGRPTGTVQFRVDGVAFGAPIPLPADTSWVTSDTTRALAVGSHSVVAVYGGDAVFGGSSSTTATQVVRAPDEARITRVLDVPNDQGRFVRLVVGPSGLDAPGASTPIVRYEVFRRIDAGAAARATTAAPTSVRLAGWDAVGSMGAYADTLYNIVVPTLADSNVAGIRWSVFFVRAATAAPSVYFDSAPDSGWSRDDLAPAAPGALHAEPVANGVRVHWTAASEPDADHYRVWRGDWPDFPADDAHLVATPTDTAWVDGGASGSWYRVAAVDVNGNVGELAGAVRVQGTPAVAFALEAPSPNPGRGSALSVRFALRSAEAARLELLDVGGRRVLAREVGELGPGWHQVTLAAGRRLAPGIYHLRLVQGDEIRRTRWVVIE